MNNHYVNMLHHPTTTLFLDDNQRFLESLLFSLGHDLSCRTFNNPNEALSFTTSTFTELHQGIYGSMPSPTPIQDMLFNGQKTLDANRFQEVSVVVVDYDMPQMNGLEVCRQITNPYIKKILLSGVADENLAIQAMNNQQIDYYINKNASDLTQQIKSAIKSLQHHYFQDMTQQFRLRAPKSIAPYIYDPSFSRFFERICSENNIVEYYLMDEPPGFLLIDQYGTAKLLLIYTEENIETYIEIAVGENAPIDLLTTLEEREYIPCFYKSIHTLYEQSLSNWQDAFYPASLINGEQTYYCAIVDNPKTDKLLPEHSTLLDAYGSTKKRLH